MHPRRFPTSSRSVQIAPIINILGGKCQIGFRSGLRPLGITEGMNKSAHRARRQGDRFVSAPRGLARILNEEFQNGIQKGEVFFRTPLPLRTLPLRFWGLKFDPKREAGRLSGGAGSGTRKEKSEKDLTFLKKVLNKKEGTKSGVGKSNENRG